MNRRLLWVGVVGLVLLVGSAAAASALTSTSGQIPFVANSGMEIVLSGDASTNVADPFVDDQTVEINTSAGTATFSSAAAVSARVTPAGLSGDLFSVDLIDMSGGELEISGDGFEGVSVSGSSSGGEFVLRRNYAVDDGTADLEVETNLSVMLPDLPPSTSVAAVDRSGEIEDIATTNATGTATFSLANGEFRLVTSAGAPDIVAPQPSGPVSTLPNNLSVELSDPDIGRSVGAAQSLAESVDVGISLNGEPIGNATVTTEGRVSVPLSEQLPAGTNNWTVSATDAFGQTTTESFQFATPANISIRNETAPSELINNSSVEVRFYFDGVRDDPDLIVTRGTSAGKVNMTGLPAGEPFVVVADTAGYSTRRIFVPSVTESQSIYLLPDSAERVDTIFEIEDYSGDFPASQTVLLVQRELGGEDWTTVLGDFFGANADFPATLAKDIRHRLVLLNTETGQRREIGTYTPIASETETVTVAPDGEFEIVGRGPTVSVSPELAQLPPRNGVDIEAGVIGDDGIESWTAVVVAVNASTGAETTLATVSNSSAATLPLQADLSGRDGERLEIRVEWTTASDSGSRTIGYRIEQSPAAGGSFLDALGAFSLLLPADDRAGVLAFIAMSTTVVGTAAVASVYQIPTEIAGLIALLFLLGFAILGWTGYDLVFLAGVALAALAFLRRRY